ncbi:ATP-binding protein [Streptomyces sp. T028]|uniref:ATP-binding protein n=1 Tax=Streptomyces sp. T028 TaxID=3394379 RepID=UPI003A86809C
MADLLELPATPATGVRATTRSAPGHLAIDLDVSPEAVPITRSIVCAHLKLWGVAGLSDRVALTVSELLANVLRHTRPAPRTGAKSAQLTVTRLSEAVNVCVRDFDPVLPKLAYLTDDAEHGRGLHLVMAYADDFGCSPHHGGKDMWANFLIGARQTATAETHPGGPEDVR